MTTPEKRARIERNQTLYGLYAETRDALPRLGDSERMADLTAIMEDYLSLIERTLVNYDEQDQYPWLEDLRRRQALAKALIGKPVEGSNGP